MPKGNSLTLEVTSLLDENIGRLAWCRSHFNEKPAADTLREVLMVLTSVSLALDYEMDGEAEKASLALERAGAKYQVGHLSDPTWDPSLVDPGH